MRRRDITSFTAPAAILLAFILLFLTCISVPFAQGIRLFTLVDYHTGGSIRFGIWGYCLRHGIDGYPPCTKPELGWTFDNVPTLTGLEHTISSQFTSALVIHPLVATSVFVIFVLAVSFTFKLSFQRKYTSNSRQKSSLRLAPATLTLVAAILASAACIVDAVIIAEVKSLVRQASGTAKNMKARTGAIPWLSFVAAIVLWISAIMLCVLGSKSRRTRARNSVDDIYDSDTSTYRQNTELRSIHSTYDRNTPDYDVRSRTASIAYGDDRDIDVRSRTASMAYGGDRDNDWRSRTSYDRRTQNPRTRSPVMSDRYSDYDNNQSRGEHSGFLASLCPCFGRDRSRDEDERESDIELASMTNSRSMRVSELRSGSDDLRRRTSRTASDIITDDDMGVPDRGYTSEVGDAGRYTRSRSFEEVPVGYAPENAVSRTPSPSYADSYERDPSTPGFESEAKVSDYISDERPRTRSVRESSIPYASREGSYLEDDDRGDRYVGNSDRGGPFDDYSGRASPDRVSLDRTDYRSNGSGMPDSFSDGRTRVSGVMSRPAGSFYESQPDDEPHLPDGSQVTDYDDDRQMTEYPGLDRRTEIADGVNEGPLYDSGPEDNADALDRDSISRSLSSYGSNERIHSRSFDPRRSNGPYPSRQGSYLDDGDRGYTAPGGEYTDGEGDLGGYVSDRRSGSRSAGSLYASQSDGKSSIADEPRVTDYSNHQTTEYPISDRITQTSDGRNDEPFYNSGPDDNTYLTDRNSVPRPSSNYGSNEMPYSRGSSDDQVPDDPYISPRRSYAGDAGRDFSVSDGHAPGPGRVSSGDGGYGDYGDGLGGYVSDGRSRASDVMSRPAGSLYDSQPGNDSYISDGPQERDYGSNQRMTEYPISDRVTQISGGGNDEPFYDSGPDDNAYSTDRNSISPPPANYVSGERPYSRGSFDDRVSDDPYVSPGRSYVDDGDRPYSVSDGYAPGPGDDTYGDDGLGGDLGGYDRGTQVSGGMSRPAEPLYDSQPDNDPYANDDLPETNFGSRPMTEYSSDAGGRSALPQNDDVYSSSRVPNESLAGEEAYHGSDGPFSDRLSNRPLSNEGDFAEPQSPIYDGVDEGEFTSPRRSLPMSEGEQIASSYGSVPQPAPEQEASDIQTQSYTSEDRATQYPEDNQEPFVSVSERSPSETGDNFNRSTLSSSPEGYAPRPLSTSVEGESMTGTEYPEGRTGLNGSNDYVLSRNGSSVGKSDHICSGCEASLSEMYGSDRPYSETGTASERGSSSGPGDTNMTRICEYCGAYIYK